MKQILQWIVVFIIGSVYQMKAQNSQKPNVIVFIADDLGWEESTPYGNPNIFTPNLQRLADEGVRFDNFYLTASSCSPSRSSILSGLYPHNTGAMNLHENMSPEILLFPELLKNAGYYSMLIGKSHGTNHPDVIAKFDVVEKANWGKPWIMGDMWLKALRERPKDKPFFMWAASIDPHYPFYQGEHPHKHKPEDVVLPPYYPDIPELREELAAYYDEIGRFDQHVGMVMDELKKQNLLDNTLIFVLSDNGKPFPQCKTRVNMQGLKSPFIVWYPKLIKSSATESLASAIDIAPTILEICGIEKPPVMQGESMVPILKDPASEIRQYAFGEHNWHVFKAFERCAITKEYIYIKNWLPHLQNLPVSENQNYPSVTKIKAMFDAGTLNDEYSDCFIAPRPAEELFDAVNDRHCMHNLSADKKNKKVLKAMRTELEEWMQQTNDIFPGEDKLKKDKFDRTRYGEVTVKEH